MVPECNSKILAYQVNHAQALPHLMHVAAVRKGTLRYNEVLNFAESVCPIATK